jgi:hypothetical protein
MSVSLQSLECPCQIYVLIKSVESFCLTDSVRLLPCETKAQVTTADHYVCSLTTYNTTPDVTTA